MPSSHRRESEGQQQAQPRTQFLAPSPVFCPRHFEGAGGEAPEPRSVGCPQSRLALSHPSDGEKEGCDVQGWERIWGIVWLVPASGWPRDAEKTVETSSVQHLPGARRQPLFLYCESLNLHFNPIGCCYYSHFTHEETEALRGHLSKVTWFETGRSLV